MSLVFEVGNWKFGKIRLNWFNMFQNKVCVYVPLIIWYLIYMTVGGNESVHKGVDRGRIEIKVKMKKQY